MQRIRARAPSQKHYKSTKSKKNRKLTSAA